MVPTARIASVVLVTASLVQTALAGPFQFSTGDPDGKMATASRPSAGGLEIESADDFVLTQQTLINSATFTGLIPTGLSASDIIEVVVEIYRVFPADSDVGRTSGPPTFSTPNVPTRVNSPSDVAFASRDSAASELSFTANLLQASFTANNSVQNGINPFPNQTTGGEGPVTGQEFSFGVTFATPFDLPDGHYFFVPQIALTTGDFFWLSAPRPIIPPGTPFPPGSPDLQEWIRNENLAPDWLRVGADIVGGNPAPTFNATFSLDGQTVQAVPEPSSLTLWGMGLAGFVARCRRKRKHSLRIKEGQEFSSKEEPIRLFDWLKPCNRGFLRSVLGVSLALAALGNAGTGHAGLVITPTFDTSITSDPNAAAIETAINNSIGIYESLFADPVNVGIFFRYATTFDDGVTPLDPDILATNFRTVWSFSYNTYINALKADGTTADDATALANLPAASAFPNSPGNLQFSSANGRAVGLITPPLSTVNGVPGVFDGVITLNSSQPFQFDRTGGIAPTNFDAMRTIEHEIDEVLGLFSTLPDGVDFAGAQAVSPEDLFRYSAPGTISFTNSSSASSYLSIDGGVTSIVELNQDPAGDYGDWVGSSTVARVQAAFGGHFQADISSPEVIALDVIGYDVVPEPSSLAIFAVLGIATALGVTVRRRRAAQSPRCS